MKHSPSRLILSLIAAAVVSQGAFAANLATVNGKPIPQARADALLEGQLEQGAAESDELRAAVRKELVRREALFQKAEKSPIAKDKKIVQQLVLAKQSVLISAYLKDYMEKNPVSEAEIKAEYDNIIKTVGPQREYKARHILVKTEKEADEVLAALKKGKKFADLAKDKSTDPGSKDKGGDLGWNNPQSFVKPFADAMVALKKGKRTDKAVKSDFGYHIIELEDVRDATPPTLEELTPQLKQRLEQKKIEAFVLKVEEEAKIK